MNSAPTPNPWQLARRAERMNPSVIREILKITERPVSYTHLTLPTILRV